MAWNYPLKPYNTLPPLPPKAEIETPAVLKAAIRATRQLAELKGSCQRLPRPDLLLNTVVLQESKDSSAIENIVTTQDALYKAILNPHDQLAPEIKEVLSYREALYAGLEELERNGIFKSSLALKVMQRLRRITAGYRSQPGTQLANPYTRNVIYTPPEPDYIAEMMSQWERFVNENEQYDPIIKMALMHYQFEAIHPFSDGNGRTGRILNVLFLISQGLLTAPVLYHSSFIIKHKGEYYKGLREVTENDNWENWVLFILNAVEETSAKTIDFIDQTLALKSRALEDMRSITQKVPAFELNELIFSLPYVKVKTLIEHGLGTRPTVSGYLEALVQKDILRVEKMGKELYYINHRLMHLLTGAGAAPV